MHFAWKWMSEIGSCIHDACLLACAHGRRRKSLRRGTVQRAGEQGDDRRETTLRLLTDQASQLIPNHALTKGRCPMGSLRYLRYYLQVFFSRRQTHIGTLTVPGPCSAWATIESRRLSASYNPLISPSCSVQ